MSNNSYSTLNMRFSSSMEADRISPVSISTVAESVSHVSEFCIRIVFFVTFREFLLRILLKNPWFSCLEIGDAVVFREV